jgi:hypothetical protein
VHLDDRGCCLIVGSTGQLDDPECRDVLFRAIRRVGIRPSVLASSPHIAAVAVRG